MNNDENIISISNLFEPEEEIEEISEDDFEQDFEMIDIDDEPPKEEKITEIKEDVIKLDDFFEDTKNETEKVEEITVKKEKKNYDKLIERIQLGLIIFLVVAGSLTYFFGYELFEPFIKID